MQSRVKIRCPTPEEDRTEGVAVDLLYMARVREREWRKFGSPYSWSPDQFRASLIGASDVDEGSETLGCDRNFGDW
ncbi:hypothetical protein TIFTF001_002003 [Ficus carica]|uniref:Uncharacterized protein n=1 Tax=Ficus carica TaxID=3494 RepID=A0AA88CSV0_FICCA|nr:hypothetical protein TIFTF001_002003 [Ficus carica]